MGPCPRRLDPGTRRAERRRPVARQLRPIRARARQRIAAFVPADHKAQFSRAAGWISKVVLLGGRVAGVWEVSDSGEHEFDLWAHVPGAALDAELARFRPRKT